ncbi:MAG: PilZ domain-containing protein [Deltaproteobacteria bacterium]|nr:PilZ domain-containing protein [Deltaproteobacteria bacterium]
MSGNTQAAMPKGANMRKYDRIEVERPDPKILLDDGYHEYTLLNVSRGGLYFWSNLPFPEGKKLVVSFRRQFQMEVEVMHQEVVMTDDVFLEAKYKCGVRFTQGPLDDDIFQQIVQGLNLPQGKP